MSKQHTDWKYKRGLMARRESNTNRHMADLVRNNCNEQIRENFFRPVYGKIGERREEKDGEC